jgi:hypothetical protein
MLSRVKTTKASLVNGTLRSVLESACEEHDFGLGDLTVLSAQVDPYRLDTPAGHRDGEWLAEQLNARKLQAFGNLFFPDLQFEVVPVALTPKQVRAENLPSTPLKEGEKRADRWREAFGVAQTEIDALTTPQNAHILRGILDEAFDPYLDRTLKDRVAEAEREWRKDAQDAMDEQVDADHLAAIRTEATAKLEELREAVDSLKSQLQLSTEDFTMPPIEVPEPEVDLDLLDPERQALVSFDDDWVAASRALIAHKSYGK